MHNSQLIPHLFRTEYSKIVSVLCKLFDFNHIEAAEDIASSTFLVAVETWPYKGIPENPTAWLYTVARNKAKNYLVRENILNNKILHSSDFAQESVLNLDLSIENTTDSQLQMLFTICHPSISIQSQIGLSLRILCGFSIDEISDALLIKKETVNKQLFRAKDKFRRLNIMMEIPCEKEIELRLKIVLKTLYLLFSEGYYSERNEEIIRKEFCLEAMRLTIMLTNNEATNNEATNSLLALMCYHASRTDARKTFNGNMVLYQDQNQELWNEELISRGNYYLQKASQSNTISKYFLEAQIAYWHTVKEQSILKWETILQLYNHLLKIEYSPIVALNRTFALSKANGIDQAIVEAEKLNLSNNYFYYVLLGELYKDRDSNKAKINFERAINLAKTDTDKSTIKQKIEDLNNNKNHLNDE